MRLYLDLYALMISVVRRCQVPRREAWRTKGVEVCRKLEGLIVRGSKVLVELHRKSGSRSTSTGRSHDIVLLHGKLRWGSKW